MHLTRPVGYIWF